MKQTISFLSLMFIAIALSGCTPSGPTTIDQYHIGISGVTMDFPTSNPKDMFEATSFGYSVLLKNQGAYTVNNSLGSLSISYDNYYITMDPSQKFRTFSLHARDIYYPIGDLNYSDVLLSTKAIGSASNSITTTLGFTLCYPYETQATVAVCIDTAPSYEKSVACRTSVYSNNAGQGAPVGVVKIEPEMIYMGNNQMKPQFKIYVQNLGTGLVINLSQQNICTQNNAALLSQNINRVRVKAMLSDRNLDCQPAELHVSPTGDNYVKCSLVAGANGYATTAKNFVSPLTVVLDYAYLDTTTQKLNIKSNSQQVNVPSPTSCAATEKLVNGVCIPLCNYCAANPGATECTTNLPTTGFKFDASFGCFCSSTKCDQLTPFGKCITGYCSGTDSCCSTTECDDKPDGTICGDNYVCINKKCSTTTECTYVEQYSSSGFACRPASQCDASNIQPNLCPGAADNVCCTVNTCSNKADGTSCGDHQLCEKGVCSQTTECDEVESQTHKGYACMQQSDCDGSSAVGGLCPAAKGICCIKATGECAGLPDYSTCGDHHVCLQNKCSTTTECAAVEQQSGSGFACRPASQCDSSSAVDGLCPASQGTCCKAPTDECTGQPDGSKCGDNYVCQSQKCSTTTLCDSQAQVQNGLTCRPTASCDPASTFPNMCPTSSGATCCRAK